MGRALSRRPDFDAVQASEVLNPPWVPPIYEWMQPGAFAVYHGVRQPQVSSEPPTDWGWQIDYVNGASRDGRPSAMGYTLYMARGGRHIQSWLNWPTLFAGFYTGPRLGSESIEVAGGSYEAFKEERDREGGMGVKKIIWYDSTTCLLLKLDVRIFGGGPLIYQCILADGGGLPLRLRDTGSAPDNNYTGILNWFRRLGR